MIASFIAGTVALVFFALAAMLLYIATLMAVSPRGEAITFPERRTAFIWFLGAIAIAYCAAILI